MLYNKDIFLTFLESKDWTNEKTYNLFIRTTTEHEDKIKKLEDDNIYFKEKFDELVETMEDTIKKYDDCLKLCDELKKENNKLKNKEYRTISTQTYIYNVYNASVDYNLTFPTEETQLVKYENKNTISKLQLDLLWDEAKEIMGDKRQYRDKNKDIIVLFCDYKKDLIRLMGKNWYKKCVKCVEEFGIINDEKHKDLYKNMVILFQEIFDNEW